MPSRGRRNKSPVGTLLAVLVIALLLVVVYLFRGPLTAGLWSVLGPVMQLRYGGTDVEAELAAARAAVADRDALYQETLDLKARLGRTDAPPVRVLAAVLSRPPASPYDTLLVDAGSEHGVVRGDVVSGGGTVVVGSVTEVFDRTARVTLYSAPGSTHEGLLGGTLPVSVEGQGGGSMRAQVPAGTEVAVDDLVVLPGIAGGLSARVSHVERGTSESYITIYFRLPMDFFGLRYVEVWKQ